MPLARAPIKHIAPPVAPLGRAPIQPIAPTVAPLARAPVRPIPRVLARAPVDPIVPAEPLPVTVAAAQPLPTRSAAPATQGIVYGSYGLMRGGGLMRNGRYYR